MNENARSGHGPSYRSGTEQQASSDRPWRDAAAAILRAESAAALADAICTNLRVTARWSPGTLRLLLGDKAVTP